MADNCKPCRILVRFMLATFLNKPKYEVVILVVLANMLFSINFQSCVCFNNPNLS